MGIKLTKRKGFNFFRSYYDVYNELESDKDKVAFINALLDRQFLGIKPLYLKGMAKFAYISQTNSIDSQVKGYEDKTGNILTPTVGGGKGGHVTPSLQVEVEDKVKEEVKDKKELSLSLENDFILFWDKYGKKNDLKKCKDKFLKLKQTEIDMILKVVDQYVLSTPDVKFRKNPLTWINGECWKDLTDTKKEPISNNGEKMIKYISNVNPTPAFMEESKFLAMQERNLSGGYIYKILN